MRRVPAEPFPAPDHVDHFELWSPTPIGTIDDVVEAVVMRQPAWLMKVSTGLGRASRRRRALTELRRGSAQAIGNWVVVDRGDRHIVFAEDLGFMRYRLTYRLESERTVSACTEVEQTTKRLGPLYWALVSPMHRRFLPRLLRNAGGDGSTVRELDPADRSTTADSGRPDGLAAR